LDCFVFYLPIENTTVPALLPITAATFGTALL